MLRTTLFPIAIAGALLSAGCARLPDTGVTTLKPRTLVGLRARLLDLKPDLDQFRPRGPYEVSVDEDRTLHLAPDQELELDVYLSSAAERAPLAILMHGLDGGKDDHAYQAFHLASWGIHSVCVQLPNDGSWTRNGETLAALVRLLQREPGRIDRRVDPDRLILVGYSYGGSSAAVALALGAPAIGAVLLDPAAIGRQLPAHLQKIRRPVLVLGADVDVSETRGRRDFYALVPGPIAEVSVRGAHHEDARFSMSAMAAIFGAGSAAEDRQLTFVSALTAAAFSLGATGRIDYAWASYAVGLRDGRLIDAQRK